MKKRLFYIVFFNLLTLVVTSQEVLIGVNENTSLKADKKVLKQSAQTDTLTLPFMDDFSEKRSYPNPELWEENEAFINQDYGKYPVTVGVATLDVIDENGNIYDDANTYPFEADHLTSNPIRLDSVFSPEQKALTPDDSIYFSFYYQPQGKANDPQPGDSLILEFLAVGENDTIYIEEEQETDTTILKGWNRVWGAGGSKLEEFTEKNGTSFKQVMIPITDSAKYFNKNFKFRFKNFASLADNSLLSWQSNVDQWNIDYVELDRDRSVADTTHRDIAFVSSAPSFLKNYQSMPYWVYQENFVNEMDDAFEMLIANLDNNAHNASYKYNVYNPSGDAIKTYDAGSYTINPFYEEGYLDYQPFSNPEITLPFPFSDDSIEYEVEHVLSTDASLENRMNDTVRYTQRFHNYFAYDDGTAEAGYGLTPQGSQLAYKFTLNEHDSLKPVLKAVKFFFNKTWHAGNEQYFYLTVWDNNNGLPGDVIYQSPNGILPEFGEDLNEYVTYEIEEEIVFNTQNAVFYVGWEQTTDEILNVGFDYSHDSRENIFYNTSGDWLQSRFEGSLMIRPVMGRTKAKNQEKSEKKSNIEIYPNPVKSSEDLQINLPDNATQPKEQYKIEIFNLSGQKIYQARYQNQVNISTLSRGMYFVKIINPVTGKKYTNKLLITQ